MNKQELLKKINKRAGKVFGLEIVISKNPKNKEYIKGFEAGKKYLLSEVIKIIKED